MLCWAGRLIHPDRLFTSRSALLRVVILTPNPAFLVRTPVTETVRVLPGNTRGPAGRPIAAKPGESFRGGSPFGFPGTAP